MLRDLSRSGSSYVTVWFELRRSLDRAMSRSSSITSRSGSRHLTVWLELRHGLARSISRSGSSYVTIWFELHRGLARATSRSGWSYVTLWLELRHRLDRYPSRSGSCYVTVWLELRHGLALAFRSLSLCSVVAPFVFVSTPHPNQCQRLGPRVGPLEKSVLIVPRHVAAIPEGRSGSRLPSVLSVLMFCQNPSSCPSADATSQPCPCGRSTFLFFFYYYYSPAPALT